MENEKLPPSGKQEEVTPLVDAEKSASAAENKPARKQIKVEKIYRDYNLFVESLVASGSLCKFKTNKVYNRILEHLPEHVGLQYFCLLHVEFPRALERCLEFCTKNDSVGNPATFTLAAGLFPKRQATQCSPTSLRYSYHACLLLKHIRDCISKERAAAEVGSPASTSDDADDITEVHVVEIGGGYGGLALAVSEMQQVMLGADKIKVSSYTILDLPSVCKLQEMYLRHFSEVLTLKFSTVDASGSGEEIPACDNLFLVSNYGFGEIQHCYQQQYVKNLFPKLAHGFLTWNLSPVFEWGPALTVLPERPLTGTENKFVTF